MWCGCGSRLVASDGRERATPANHQHSAVPGPKVREISARLPTGAPMILDAHARSARIPHPTRGRGARRPRRPRCGRPASGRATTPSGRTTRPRSPIGSAGSTVARRCGQPADLAAFAAALAADGSTTPCVLGMGGSSLFPEVLARTFGAGPGGLELHVLDTTDPAAVARVGHRVRRRAHAVRRRVEVGHHHRDPQPPRALLGARPATPAPLRRHHRPRLRAGRAGRASAAFRAVFENPPDIGGRYSALSLFGLVPARARRRRRRRPARRRRRPPRSPPTPTGQQRRAPARRRAWRAGVAAGRDKLTLVLDPEHRHASASGSSSCSPSHRQARHRRPPVAGEPLGRARGLRRRPPVRRHRRRRPRGLDALAAPGTRWSSCASTAPDDLGAQVLLWEVATALCGAAARHQPVRPAQRRRGQGGHRRRCSTTGGADRRRRRPLDDAARPGRPGRLRGHPGLRRSRAPARRRPRGAPGSRSATGCGWPPPSASAPASSTPPASSTRAARRPACSSRWSATTRSTSPSPGGPTASRRSSRRRRPATSRTLQSPRPAGRPGASTTSLGDARGGRVKLGMVGLGKMGGNMAERLRGARPRGRRLRRLQRRPSDVASLGRRRRRRSAPPRVVWVMVPAGDPDRARPRPSWPALLAPGDVVVDGGNSNCRDSMRRGRASWPTRASASSTAGTERRRVGPRRTATA